jgi:hypothetical protein
LADVECKDACLAREAGVETGEHMVQIVRRRVAKRIGPVVVPAPHFGADDEGRDAVGVEEARVLPSERARGERAYRAEVLLGEVPAEAFQPLRDVGPRSGECVELEDRHIADQRAGAIRPVHVQQFAEVHGHANVTMSRRRAWQRILRAVVQDEPW